ncbi:hypothetical protein FHX64_002537 [Microbacter margulisiae]|uniref:Uncharacterized protein n=1 Tax=Microbacter margulisiae TaxID=1350067 RepID=A0A7W5DSN9_9PORP|nr:hypothetical protein [Microbacter margulisiae]
MVRGYALAYSPHTIILILLLKIGYVIMYILKITTYLIYNIQ